MINRGYNVLLMRSGGQFWHDSTVFFMYLLGSDNIGHQPVAMQYSSARVVTRAFNS